MEPFDAESVDDGVVPVEDEPSLVVLVSEPDSVDPEAEVSAVVLSVERPRAAEPWSFL